MTLQLAFNTTDVVVVVDGSGHLIGGHGWGPVDTLDPIGKAALDDGRLVKADEASAAASDNPDASAAVSLLIERRERAKEAAALNKAELAERLEDADVDLDGGESVAELREAAVAEPDVSLQPKTGAKRPATKK